MKLTILIVILFMISFISALCEDGQIDINTASLEELDELSGIGPVKSQAIIDAQPFNSVDDLIDVYGIGPATLEKIIKQGLACVKGEIMEEEIVKEDIQEVVAVAEVEKGKDEEIELIILTTQTIKSPDNKENKSNYALYGFVGFCFVLGILFMLRRKKYKNEFR